MADADPASYAVARSMKHIQRHPRFPSSCVHGMQIAAHNVCRFCIDDRLAEILALLKQPGEGWVMPKD